MADGGAYYAFHSLGLYGALIGLAVGGFLVVRYLGSDLVAPAPVMRPKVADCFCSSSGLMELIVLNIGLDLRVISPTLFAMLVMMALVTTFATTPILDALSARGDRRGNQSAAGRDGPLASPSPG